MIKTITFAILLFTLLSFSQKDKFTVSNLNINTESPHFGLMQLANNEVIFTSYQLTKKGKVKQVSGNPVLTIYKGILSNGQIINANSLGIDPNAGINHITSATVSLDGKNIFVTTNYTKKNKPKGDFKDTNFHIAVGEFKAGLGWTNFKVLPFCNPKFSYGHPALSTDGKILYFIANIRGGKETTKGGSDIFKVDILADNQFSEPKNLGSKVNSYSREMFPFISNDNTLYFASNRPGGYGGFDIYKSIMNAQGTFEKAVKMPKPINSVKDDFSLITSDNNTGYFSSKRPKGKGDDDIYYFISN